MLTVGTQVLSAHGQAGIIVPRTTTMWPTLVQVKWVGTSFLTFEDPYKLKVVWAPASDVQVSATSHTRRTVTKLRDHAAESHAALLARARQRAGVAA